MAGNNRVAMGILTGAGSGAVTGIAGGPWGILAGAVIGGLVGGISGDQADKADANAEREREAQLKAGADEQNRKTAQAYEKRKRAMGISDASGVTASDMGGSIISGNNQASGLTSIV